MSYKTILVHVDESARAGERIKIAAAIAMAEGGRLIGSAMSGASRYLMQTRMLEEMDPNLRTHLEFLRQRAQRGLEDFATAAQRLGLHSFEQRLVDDEAGGGICLQARYADLVVIGQNDINEMSPVVLPDFPQYVVLNSGRPVLLVPHTGRFDNIGQRVLIAWDESAAATRSITNALPLLRRAQMVEVVIFKPETPMQPPGAAASHEIALYLAQHGVKAEVLSRDYAQDTGHALLSLALERQSDLLVMGGYGHARFRDIMLGGVTRTVLETMSIPVLMTA